MNVRTCLRLAMFVGALSSTAILAAPPATPLVERTAVDHLTISWTSADPVDVLVADKANMPVAKAVLVSARDKDGRAEIESKAAARSYVILRNAKTGEMVRIAERVVPLTQGSNFRDIGGYATANGKHVRWGLLYRSGASAMLTADDLATVKGLGLSNLVDLRSDEERQLAPTRIDGVAYSAVGYSMATLLAGMSSSGGTPQNGAALYHNLPTMLAPQMRLLFNTLKRNDGPVEYNCSAGQDRTGFATALILSALGVPRETIYKDYLLSVKYRQPRNEMPHIDPALYPGNAAAQLFSRYQDNPAYAVPQPLQEADGTPFLKGAFDEIDAKWGSVEVYLEKEIGVTKVDLAKLKLLYLE